MSEFPFCVGGTAVRRTFNWTILSGGLITKELGLFPFYWSVPLSFVGTDKTFQFPTIQYCQNGQVEYYTAPPSNSDDDDEGNGPDPAPFVKYSATASLTSASQTAVSSKSDSWSRSDTLSVIAIILSIIAILALVGYALKKFLESDMTHQQSPSAGKKLVA